MPTITIRISEKEKEFLEYMANFLGISLSKVVKEYTIEQLEDIYDAKVGDEALKEYKKKDEKSMSIDKIMKQWNIK